MPRLTRDPGVVVSDDGARRPVPFLLVAGASVLLVGGAIWSWRSTDLALSDLELLPAVLILLVLAPLNVGANALEFRAVARGLGVPLDLRAAARVTVIATAANLAPAPGGVLTRAAVLRRHDVEARRIAAGLGAAGALWLGVAVTAAAVVVLLRGQPLAAATGAGIAAVGTVTGVVLARSAGLSAGTVGRIVGVEVLAVALGAARLAAGVATLGGVLALSDAFVLGGASTLASAAGIAPGGIGLAEALAAAVAPLVAAAPAVAFAAVAVNRVLGLAVTGIAGASLGSWTRSPARSDAP